LKIDPPEAELMSRLACVASFAKYARSVLFKSEDINSIAINCRQAIPNNISDGKGCSSYFGIKWHASGNRILQGRAFKSGRGNAWKVDLGAYLITRA
jgi:hypothetical protein